MINKQKLFEYIKVILYSLFVGVVVLGLLSSLFKGVFTGIFVLLFYFSFENFFLLKNEEKQNFTKKITTIIGFSIGLLVVSTLITGIAISFIER